MQHGRESTVQDMISPVILVAPLNAQHISWLGNHTNDGMIPAVTGTDPANIVFRKILANLAEANGMFCIGYRISKRFGFLIGKRQHVKRKPLCAFLSHTGQRCKFIN